MGGGHDGRYKSESGPVLGYIVEGRRADTLSWREKGNGIVGCSSTADFHFHQPRALHQNLNTHPPLTTAAALHTRPLSAHIFICSLYRLNTVSHGFCSPLHTSCFTSVIHCHHTTRSGRHYTLRSMPPLLTYMLTWRHLAIRSTRSMLLSLFSPNNSPPRDCFQ